MSFPLSAGTHGPLWALSWYNKGHEGWDLNDNGIDPSYLEVWCEALINSLCHLLNVLLLFEGNGQTKILSSTFIEIFLQPWKLTAEFYSIDPRGGSHFSLPSCYGQWSGSSTEELLLSSSGFSALNIEKQPSHVSEDVLQGLDGSLPSLSVTESCNFICEPKAIYVI